MKFFEITLQYRFNKKKETFSCMIIEADENTAFKMAKAAMFIKTGQWFEVLAALITEITEEEYFLIPEL